MIGWFGGVRRREGEVFDVPKGAKARWFVPADEDLRGPKVRGRSATDPTDSTGDGSPEGTGASDAP